MLDTVNGWTSWLVLQVLEVPGATTDEIDPAMLVQALVGMLFLIVALVTVIVFGIWIVRAHRNLLDLGASELDVTPGWALGWFFVPIAFYWKPYQAMRTLLQASRKPQHWQGETVPWWLPAWWTLWILSNLLSQASMRTSLRSITAPSDIEMAQLDVVTAAVDVVLFGFAIRLVARIWLAQRAQRAAGLSTNAVTEVVPPAIAS